MSDCKCSMAISVLGDGCRYCQPQEHIDNMTQWLVEEREELAKAEQENAELRRIIAESQKQEPVGWRIKFNNLPSNYQNEFNCGAPSDETVKYWKDNNGELELCYTSPVIQEGMQLVPIEPTEKMIESGLNQSNFDSSYQIHRIWEDMINASKEK